jgi:carbon monoxide dehydrogenase subunit G
MNTISFTIQASDGRKTVSQVLTGGMPQITGEKHIFQLDGNDPEIAYKFIINAGMVLAKITGKDMKQILREVKDLIKENDSKQWKM